MNPISNDPININFMKDSIKINGTAVSGKFINQLVSKETDSILEIFNSSAINPPDISNEKEIKNKIIDLGNMIRNVKLPKILISSAHSKLDIAFRGLTTAAAYALSGFAITAGAVMLLFMIPGLFVITATGSLIPFAIIIAASVIMGYFGGVVVGVHFTCDSITSMFLDAKYAPENTVKIINVDFEKIIEFFETNNLEIQIEKEILFYENELELIESSGLNSPENLDKKAELLEKINYFKSLLKHAIDLKEKCSLIKSNIIDTLHMDLLNNVNAENIDASKIQLISYLRNADVNPSSKFKISKYILYSRNSRNKLKLSDNDALYIEAIIQYTTCDPQQTTALNHPYRVYGNLKMALANEKNYQPKIELTPQVIDNKQVSFSIQKPKPNDIAGYTIKDIPESFIPKDNHNLPILLQDEHMPLADLFNQLKANLSKLSKKDLKTSLKEINDFTLGSKIDELENNLLYSQKIKELLILPAKETDSLTPAQIYLYRIMDIIKQSMDKPIANSFLTEGEILLLKFSMAVQNCVIGQRDGVINYYHSMPMDKKIDYEIKGIGNDTPLLERAKLTVETIIEGAIQETLTNNNLLKELTGKISANTSHISLYLSNRLSEQIPGFKHTLEFDPYTLGILNHKLLNTKLEPLLETFYKYYTPKRLVEKIIINSPQLMKSNIFQGIIQIIQTEVEKNGPFNLSDYITYDDDNDTMQFNELAAVTLLKALRYLNVA